MLAVIVILLVLIAAGIRLGGNPGAASRRSATHLVSGLVEYARATAISRRTSVLLALAAPAGLPAGGDGRYRVGLFQITADLGGDGFLTELSRREAIPLGRWRALDRPVILGTGGESGLVNPMDEPALEIRLPDRELIRVHGVILDRRGGIHWPAGSTPVVIRIGEGVSKQGRAEMDQRGGAAAENLLRIGRHNSRTYQIDR